MRKLTSPSGIIVLIAVLFSTVFIGCRKTDQKPAERVTVKKNATKNFFSVLAGTDEIVHAVAKKIYRQNERKPFTEELVKRVGYPNWSHSLIAEGPYQSGKRIILYIPFAKEEERRTKAILRVVIDGADTAFKMFYPQQYKKFGFTPKNNAEWNAQNLFNAFADFDYDIFGTSRHLVKDGRIFGKKMEELVIVTRQPTDNNKSSMASRMASVTVCNTWTSCVYASENPDDGGSCITTTNCTTYWYDDGVDTGGTSGGSGDGGSSSGSGGDGDDGWPDDPCSSGSVNIARIPSDDDPTDPGSGEPCDEEPWIAIAAGEAIPCKSSFNFVKQGNWQSAVITDYRFTFYESKTKKIIQLTLGI